MKGRLLILILLFAISTPGHCQTGGLKKEQIKVVEQLINIIKTKNKTKIAGFIYFPLRRVYPVKDVKDKEDFINRFDEIFDQELINHISNSKIEDWTEVGWRGIMLDNGTVWIDNNGKIVSINYQSPKEKQLLANMIKADKNRLPQSLQNFEKPVYKIITKSYEIRIDENTSGKYRYASWQIKNRSVEPDLVIENGILEFQGSGGNHIIRFKNKHYTYIISINKIRSKEIPEAALEILKDDQPLLTENGTIKRN